MIRATLTGIGTGAIVFALATVCGGVVGPTLAPAASAGGSSIVVVVRGSSYRPAFPTIPQGASVTWVNRDREAHTVTSDSGLFDAEIGPGQQFTYTFEAPGAYFYYCLPHDWMIGEITVSERAAAAGEPG